MATSTERDRLAEEYLAAKGPYNAARARLDKAITVEAAAAMVLQASRDAFVAAGGVLAELPPAQPEIKTPPTKKNKEG